jgi:hypothetical protein
MESSALQWMRVIQTGDDTSAFKQKNRRIRMKENEKQHARLCSISRPLRSPRLISFINHATLLFNDPFRVLSAIYLTNRILPTL